MDYEQLKLSNQFCFPVYAASRLIIREYQPYLDRLEITYPQYLVLLVLWEQNGLTVNDIATKLILNTNTITPLLKRMEAMNLITRTRSTDDERKVVVCLTPQADDLKQRAAQIPMQLVAGLKHCTLPIDDFETMKDNLKELITFLQSKHHNNDM